MKTNQVILLGYVGNDLSDVVTTSGKHKVNIRVATHFYDKLSDGSKKWYTVWHDIVAWDKTAKYAARNFVRGSKILVEGSICYRTYADYTGHIRYVTEIKASHLTNLDR